MHQMFGLDQTKFFLSQKVLPKTESNARCVIQPFSEKKFFFFSLKRDLKEKMGCQLNGA
jgi:hypothetical protein